MNVETMIFLLLATAAGIYLEAPLALILVLFVVISDTLYQFRPSSQEATKDA